MDPRVTALEEPDVCAVKVYFFQDPQIRVHQSRVNCVLRIFQPGFTGMVKSEVVRDVHRSGFRSY